MSSCQKNWNKLPTYELKYVNNKELFILQGVTAEDDIVFNFMVRKSNLLLSGVNNIM